MKAVYLALDFDGVLHPEGCDADIEFCHLPRLEAVLREHPAVRLVISSMWRTDHSLEQLRALFSPDIAERIDGVTPYLAPPGPHYIRGTREREIVVWMKNHSREGVWLALDDRASGFEPRCPNLLLVPEDGIGLQEHHLDELSARLGALVKSLESTMPATYPSVLEMMRPDFLIIRDVPSIRSVGERIDAALRPHLESGADVAELCPGDLLESSDDKSGIKDLQFVHNLRSEFAGLRGRRADGTVVKGADFAVALRNFASGKSPEDGAMQTYFHFDLRMLRDWKPTDAAGAQAAAAAAEPAPPARRRRP